MECYCLDCEKPCEVVPEKSDNGHEGHSYHAWTQYGCEFCGGGNISQDGDPEREVISQEYFQVEQERLLAGD